MKVSAGFFGVVVALVACALDPAVHFAYVIPKQYALLLASAAALLFWALRAPIASRSRLQLSAIEVTLVASVLWGVITNPRGLATQAANWFWLALAAFMLTLVARQLFTSSRETRLVAVADLMTALWIVGSALAAHGLATAIAAGGFQPVDLSEKTLVTSVMGIPNSYGAFMATGVIGALASAAEARGPRVRLLLIGSAVLQLVALIGNGSRGALLGMVAGGLLVLWLRPLLGPAGGSTARRRWAFTAGTVAMIVVSVAGFLLHQLNPGSGRGRLMAWEVSGAMLRNAPLTGVGAGRFGAEWASYQVELWRDAEYARFDRQAVQRAQPNSELFHRLAERGLPGGVLYVLLWAFVLGFLIRDFRRNEPTSAVDWGLLALLVAILVHSLVDGTLRWIPTLVIAHLAFGLVPAPSVVEADIEKGRGRNLIVAFAVLWAAIVGFKLLREYPGYHYWWQARRAGSAERLDLLVRAQQRLPWDSNIDQELGAGLLAAGRLEEAEKVLQQGLESQDDPETRLALAEAQLGLGWLEPAEVNARSAASGYPDRLGPRLLLARIHHASGEDAQARAALASCIRRDTYFRSAAVDSVVAEAAQLWRNWYDDEPPR